VKRTDKLLCGIYAAIAAAALIGTWQQNLAFFALPGDHGVEAFIGAASANPAAASISIDIAFFSLAAFVWMAVEARRLGVRFVWVYIALSCLIAVSVMFPLFLIARQMRLVGNRAAT
jgi:hypothetical protein